MITQKDIADKIGVTRVLVSRALSNHPSVALSTRERIQAVATELGYTTESNSAAKSLIATRYNKTVRTGVVALTMWASFEDKQLKDMPFFTPFFKGLEDEAKARGLEICLCPLNSSLNGEVPRLIASRSVDGVLALSNVSLVQPLRAMNLPVVALDVYCDEAPHLVPNDRDGMRQATQHLIDLGHRRIAYIGYTPNFPSSSERFAGFQSALYENGLRLDESLWQANLNHGEAEHGAAAMKRLLGKQKGKPNFSAVVCYHDLFALGAVRALLEAGLSVPGDISVVGFDDVSAQYNAEPLITSIAFDREAMARRALAILCEGEASTPLTPHREVFPVELVVRDSTREAQLA